MPHRCYHVHGLQLRAVAQDDRILHLLDQTLGRYATDASEGIAIHLHRGPVPDHPPAGDDLPLIHDGPTPDGFRIVCRADATRRHVLQPGRFAIEIDLDTKDVHVRFAPEAESAFRYQGAFLILCELLRTIGQHHLHAATLLHEDGGAIILAGPGGAGKTTTALALADMGLRMLADDASFLCREATGQLAVWGLPLPCKVHRNTLAMIPWLKTLPHRPAREPDEIHIDVGHGETVDPGATFPAGTLVFLEPRNQRGHAFGTLTAVEAIHRLSRDNLRALDRRGEGAAGEAFRMTVRLAETCRRIRLSAGPTTTGLAEALLAAAED